MRIYSSVESAKIYLTRILARKSYGSWEIRKKLDQRSSLSAGQKEDIINRFREIGILNDNEYTLSKFNSQIAKKNKSPKLISWQLKSKGFPGELVDSMYTKSRPDEMSIAQEIVEKKMRSGKKSSEYLKRHLASKGFNFDTISKVMSHISERD